MANDAIPCTDTPIVRSVSINSKSTSYTGATCASFSEPKIGKANFRHLESENVFNGVQLSFPMKVVKTSPKNATTIPTVDMMNDGFQTVVNEIKSGKTGSANTNRYGVNVAPSVSNSAKDCPNNVQWSSKKQHSKDDDIPSSSYTSDTIKKDGLKVFTSLSNIPTSNPYDLLYLEFDPENYTRSGVTFDMES
ncbi:hypothetical protein Tco_1307437 [Tanacetum coccineum]